MKSNTDLNNDQLDNFAEASVQYNVEKQLRERYGKILSENKKATPEKGRVISINPIVKVAVVVVTIIGSVFLINDVITPSNPQSMAQNFLNTTQIPGNPDITRKGVSTAEQLQREANDAFIQGKFDLAIQKYEQFKGQKEFSALDQYYLGVSHLKLNDHDKAIALLEEINADTSIPIQEVDWLLGLAYVLTDQKDKAKPILDGIISSNAYKAKEAKELYKTLK